MVNEGVGEVRGQPIRTVHIQDFDCRICPYKGSRVDYEIPIFGESDDYEWVCGRCGAPAIDEISEQADKIIDLSSTDNE